MYLGVVASLAARLAGEVNPLVLVGGTRAGPRGGVELFVPDVVASVAGVCFDTVGPDGKKRGGYSNGGSWRAAGRIYCVQSAYICQSFFCKRTYIHVYLNTRQPQNLRSVLRESVVYIPRRTKLRMKTIILRAHEGLIFRKHILGVYICSTNNSVDFSSG